MYLLQDFVNAVVNDINRDAEINFQIWKLRIFGNSLTFTDVCKNAIRFIVCDTIVSAEAVSQENDYEILHDIMEYPYIDEDNANDIKRDVVKFIKSSLWVVNNYRNSKHQEKVEAVCDTSKAFEALKDCLSRDFLRSLGLVCNKANINVLSGGRAQLEAVFDGNNSLYLSLSSAGDPTEDYWRLSIITAFNSLMMQHESVTLAPITQFEFDFEMKSHITKAITKAKENVYPEAVDTHEL